MAAIDDLLFVHPLLGTDDAWSGYLVETAPGARADAALAGLVRKPQLREFDRRAPWLLPAAPGIAGKDAVDHAAQLFPPRGDEAQQAFEAELRQGGHKLGLRATPDEKLPLPGTWDYVLVANSHGRSLRPFALVGLSSRSVVVATEVLSHADHAWGHANACTLSTAEFLLTRNPNGKKADTTRVKLLEMLALIAEDAPTEAIEEVFRQEPKLSYSLLRLVNSAAIAPRKPITSFAQAIDLLGRRQLQRWLQLLVYADPNNGHHPNPLLQKAAARGRLLELLAQALQPPPEVANLADAAFMVGVFSLLDILLNMSMHEILQQLPLADAVRGALTDYSGPLGNLLRAVDAAEKRDLAGAASLLQRTTLDGAAYIDAQLAALAWAAKIRPTC